MYFRRIILSICTLVISTPALSSSLQGKWFSSASYQEGVLCWVNERRADGTYRVSFLFATPSGIKRHSEEGTWFFSNNLYATATNIINGESVDPSDRRLREVYKVLRLEDDCFKYSDIGSEAVFEVVRVSDDFAITDNCPSF